MCKLIRTVEVKAGKDQAKVLVPNNCGGFGDRKVYNGLPGK